MRRSLLYVLCAVACSPAPLDIIAAPPPTPPRVALVAKPDAGAAASAFEDPGGMWLPGQLPEQASMLRKAGLAIDPAVLGDPRAYPLSAVVSLGGCSASFVSGDGLIVTNHHCVTGALQYNSKPGADLLHEGFLAKTRADEKSIGPTGRVFVTRAFTDVTAKVRDGIEAIKDDLERFRSIDKREKELVAACEKEHPDARCEVADYFGGGQYLLIERLEIKDVRLVYAPASGIGNFGGEIDNWRWPRHAGDFGFYRAYVGKGGKPADYSPDNVPYHPAQHLRVARHALGAGDFVFVAGYPGRTYRLSTAEEVEEAVDWYYPRRIKLCEDYLAMLGELGKHDEDARLKSTPLARGLANVLTYTRGSLEGLSKGGAEAKREERDKKLRAFIAADPERKRKYSDVFEKLDALFADRKRTRDLDVSIEEVLRLGNLIGDAVAIVHNAGERAKPDAERDPGFQERDQEHLVQTQEAIEHRYNRALDSALLAQALIRISHLPAEVRGPLLEPLIGKEGKPTDDMLRTAARRLMAGTRLENTKWRVQLVKTATVAQLRRTRDPLIQVALKFRLLEAASDDRSHARDGVFALARSRYVAALREMTPGPLAPDANGTLRVTYGTVRGYRPRPGAPVYAPFTVANGVLAKATGKDPFDAPQRLLDAIKQRKGARFADTRLGDVPVDFLSDVDITGGNSGSPTLDANGDLVGLAFDGNYEAMASDWLFMPDITRAIHVDIRYVLFIMNAVDHADALLAELGVKPGSG